LLLNFEAILCKEFGEVHALAPSLPYALQFSKSIEPTQQRAMRGVARQYVQSIRQFVSDFRSSLSDEVLGDQAYSFKVFLRRVSTTLRQVLTEFSELFMCAGPAY